MGVATINASVEAETTFAHTTPPDNGAGPLWCFGSSVVARNENGLFVCARETIPDTPPLNNCRWTLYHERDGAFDCIYRDETGRTREPCPTALLNNNDLIVTANPSIAPPETSRGPAEPAVFRFNTSDIDAGPRRESPVWEDSPAFTEHSYRTVSADAANDEVLYMQNVGYDKAFMSFLNRNGTWQSAGTITWPWGGEYPEPQPLRLCYPNVFLKDRAAYFLGVGDIVEPIQEWRDAKFKITGREWDYVFRRLFFAYIPDITTEPFGPWRELSNYDATAGMIRNMDIWVDEQNVAHLLWKEESTDARIRDEFFPDEVLVSAIRYARIRDGQLTRTHTLSSVTEYDSDQAPFFGRFHILENGRLIMVMAFEKTPLLRIATVPGPDTQPEWIDVPLSAPIHPVFQTNTPRNGNAPSNTIDILAQTLDDDESLRYIKVNVTCS